MEKTPERRQGKRLPVSGRPNGRVRATLDARLVDLSGNGARIEHLNLLRPGFLCTLELPQAVGDLSVQVQVVRSLVVGAEAGPTGERVLRYESGLVFTKLTPGQQESLAAILDRLAAAEDLGNGRLVL